MHLGELIRAAREEGSKPHGRERVSDPFEMAYVRCHGPYLAQPPLRTPWRRQRRWYQSWSSSRGRSAGGCGGTGS
eukprot:scaffold2739_cov257-Pinguiococcus_pyrenoidosus.AAC.15